MPAYSYIVDNDGDVWVFVGNHGSGTAVYDPAFALESVDADDVPGQVTDRFSENDIASWHGIRSHGPEILPVHTGESDAADEYERTHTFVNIP